MRQALRSHVPMRAPEPYFDPQTVVDRSRAWQLLGTDGLFPVRYLTAVTAACDGDPGVWCTALMWSHLRWLVRMARLARPSGPTTMSDPDAVASWFPTTRYVRIRSADLSRQALRFYARLHPSAPGSRSPVLDVQEVRWLETLLLRQEKAWDVYFSLHGIPVVTVVFEEFLTDPESSVDAIVDGLGLPRRPPEECQPVAARPPEDDEEWWERYRRERDRLAVRPGVRGVVP